MSKNWFAILLVMMGNPSWEAVFPQEHAHTYMGSPSQPFHERQGYFMAYDAANRIPAWVAYRIEPAFLEGKPERKGKYKSFRTDNEMPDSVKDADYKNSGFARGHLAPWAVMGGDRDGDGLFAADDDDFDNETIFQANFMSNITPQLQTSFNGAGALWFNLEEWERKETVEAAGFTVWVVAGPILGKGPMQKIGPSKDITVPPMFFKIIVREQEGDPVILAFMFPHQRTKHGKIEDFLVSVDLIEQMTGLDFFQELDDDLENAVEAQDTFENWKSFLSDD